MGVMGESRGSSRSASLDRRLRRRVRQALADVAEGRYLLPRSDLCLVVGVSGGPDSLALLHILAHILSPQQIVVAHLDHGLRVQASAEARFVTATAAGWSLPCHVERVDVRHLAQTENWSVEEAGRNARYAFFAKLAREMGSPVVAVGHHRGDQAETLLLNLVRGTGLAGLRGMAAEGPLPGDPELRLLRPLLSTSRAEIEAYCRQHGLRPVIDDSNTDPTFLRNRVRHELMPLLAQYNPQFERHLAALADMVSTDYEIIVAATNEAWNLILWKEERERLVLHRRLWQSLSRGLQRNTLRRAIQQLQPSPTDLSFQVIEDARNLINRNRSEVHGDLPGGLVLRTSHEEIVLAESGLDRRSDLWPQTREDSPVGLPVPGKVMLSSGWYVEATVDRKTAVAEIRESNDRWQAYVALPEGSRLHVRPYRQGERFQPLGMGGHTARLSDVLANRKVGQRWRKRWPVVAIEEHAAWLVGYHIDDRLRVVAHTSPIVRLRCRRANDQGPRAT